MLRMVGSGAEAQLRADHSILGKRQRWLRASVVMEMQSTELPPDKQSRVDRVC